MSSVEALQRGDLHGALTSLQDEVRAEPGEARHRVFLFQLLSVLGDWDRALTQLNVARDLDPNALLMAKTYQEVLNCEVFRQDVFSGKRSPLILGEPDTWLAKTVEAQRLSARGEVVAAHSLRQKAWEDAPTTAGTIVLATGDAEPRHVDFQWIADSDSRLGPLLEVIVEGKYYWAPFHYIAKMEIQPPSDLRDVVWMPAQFTWVNQGQAVGMIPTRYPASEAEDDAELRLARRTEWSEPVEGVFHGVGQRELATDVGEFALMNVRKITLNPSMDAGA